MHISPYEQGNIYNVDPLRPKKLLLHKAEIRRLREQVMQQGYALVPLEVYLKDGRMKLQLGVCKGKKNYDKRDDMARRDAQREIERVHARSGITRDMGAKMASTGIWRVRSASGSPELPHQREIKH